MKRNITPEVIRQLFTYNPTSGSLCWRERALGCFATPRAYSTWNKRFADTEAGGVSGFGYLYVTIYVHLMLKHRVIWAYVYGEWPENQIDHINGDRLDNSISNLRHVTHAEMAAMQKNQVTTQVELLASAFILKVKNGAHILRAIKKLFI